MYNPKSTKAEEFIANEEILATLEYAKISSFAINSSAFVIKF